MICFSWLWVYPWLVILAVAAIVLQFLADRRTKAEPLRREDLDCFGRAGALTADCIVKCPHYKACDHQLERRLEHARHGGHPDAATRRWYDRALRRTTEDGD